MLTLLGIKKLKKALVKLGQKEDAQVNAILQQAVDDINIVKAERYPPSTPTP